MSEHLLARHAPQTPLLDCGAKDVSARKPRLETFPRKCIETLDDPTPCERPIPLSSRTLRRTTCNGAASRRQASGRISEELLETPATRLEKVRELAKQVLQLISCGSRANTTWKLRF